MIKFKTIPEKNKDDYYMTLALEEATKAAATGEVPVGAVLVCNDAVVARAFNKTESDCSALAHAEMLVLREACEKLKRWRLSDAVIYVTLEPCAMCAGAMVLSRIRRLVYGVYDSKAGAVDSLFNIGQTSVLNHQMEVRSGVKQDECANILKSFFASCRQKV